MIATEQEEQAALVQWAQAIRYRGRPVADYLVMIPNESLMSLLPKGPRRFGWWDRLKAMGFRKGASDLFLALPVGTCPGLWIEMKRGPKAFPTPRARETAVSEHQREFLDLMASVGYQVQVAYGWEQARQRIERYLQIGNAVDLVPELRSAKALAKRLKATGFRKGASDLFLALLLCLMPLASMAQEYTPGAQLGTAIETGRLPAWVSAGARLELRFTGLRVVTCLEDRERTRRWVTWGHWDDYLAWTLTGRWTFRKAEPVPPEYWAMCGFPVPEPAKALGEPAYWAVHCSGPCKAETVDWALTNREANLAGTTTKGEACGPAMSNGIPGWHWLPRIKGPGSLPAVTRCAP